MAPHTHLLESQTQIRIGAFEETAKTEEQEMEMEEQEKIKSIFFLIFFVFISLRSQIYSIENDQEELEEKIKTELFFLLLSTSLRPVIEKETRYSKKQKKKFFLSKGSLIEADETRRNGWEINLKSIFLSEMKKFSLFKKIKYQLHRLSTA
ncbi:hypothetical protein BpHYR1_022344 [Brachionus plicatilis]|uniref:Uncharacterized protein n=1 Tax=Brachionus plicatilis TaxID=10195 RepID=A0A3M7T2P6_BRAPC|nr:hypothetical protein BpHYR1_022344 [Brachionus plicatilis]